jgi:hypothetical protein
MTQDHLGFSQYDNKDTPSFMIHNMKIWVTWAYAVGIP